jgi:hypothetical protein
MSEDQRTKLVVAVAVNLAVGQALAAAFGLPRLAGTVVAGAAMAAASVPSQLSPPVRDLAQLAVLPGNIVANAIGPTDTIEKPKEPCGCH